MSFLLRLILILILIALLVRTFARPLDKKEPEKKDIKPGKGNKKVSDKIGEYVDYEELEK